MSVRLKFLRRAFAIATIASHSLAAQGFTTNDTVLKHLYVLGNDSSHVERLAQVLTDSIGPRLTGTSGLNAARRWIMDQYTRWGISAREEQYGTWRGWKRGTSTVELTSPHARNLDAMLLAWSPGTRGPVTGAVVTLPRDADSATFAAWLPRAGGKYVMISTPEMTCRPDESVKQSASPEVYDRFVKERTLYMKEWDERVPKTRLSEPALVRALERAGAAGVLTSIWSEGWGVQKVHDALTERVPSLAMSCEDYGLLARLAERGQSPVIRVNANAEFPGDVPVFNTIAELRGVERPDEYVILSAHLDSWDSASGATDNGTGTVMMMEAMRLLKASYPHPKRTILVGHWSGEEQRGLGSTAFAADHPEILKGTQALFNQDNGTGRITKIGMSGFMEAGNHFATWLSRMPTETSRFITVLNPGLPGGGSDHLFFLCHGVPAFSLSAEGWDYSTYTWHTTLDTFDKISIDDLRLNATLVAMLAYEASEDPRLIERTQRVMPVNASGTPRAWPACPAPKRKFTPPA